MFQLLESIASLINCLVVSLRSTALHLARFLLLKPRDKAHSITWPSNSETASFTFTRTEVLANVLLNQWKWSVKRQHREYRQSENKCTNAFSVLKLCSKWNKRKNDAVRCGKTWFTNGKRNQDNNNYQLVITN